MSKIKTANEILEKHVINDEDESSLHTVLLAMREYAEQFIDLAAEGVRTKTSKTMWQGMSDFVEITEIDKESILEIKQLIK